MSKTESPFIATLVRRLSVIFSFIVWRGALVLVLFCMVLFSAFGQTSVLTQHNDNARTGQNISETILNTTNVNVNQFGKLFAMPTDGQVYAQPLYVSGVTINGAVHNVVIVATENDSVYAYDADSGGAPLWKASMVDAAHGAGAGETALNSAATIACTDMQPLIGITSTPVIDPASETIYVEAKSTNGTSYFHRLHALDLHTGNEKTPGPVLIDATVSGTGDGSSNGQLVFHNMALYQLNRPGLLLLNGTIYIAYASHCDYSPYHGWLFAYDEATFTLKSVYVTTSNGGTGGFWMSGAGVAADASGNIFIASGNGDFDTTHVPATETGDTILKLGTTNQVLNLLDYFTPQDQSNLDGNDLDLGSGGVLLLPNQPGSFPHILVEAGKEGRIYVVNRDQMTTGNSHYCSGCANDTEIIEETGSGAIGGIWGMPAYWNDNIYFWPNQDYLRSIPITDGLPNFTNISRNSTSLGFPGAMLSISSNGTTAGTAILWAIDATQYGSPGPGPGPAVVYAYDATNVSKELWNSTQAPNNRDKAGNAVKFSTPTISNGKVYVGTSSEVGVYGLLNSNLPTISSISPSSTTAGGPAFALTIDGTGFVSGATVNFGSNPAITPSSVSSTQIVATIPAVDIANAGTVNVTVTNPAGGGTSGAQVFTVNTGTAAPTITSANSTTFTVGSAGSFTVTATGKPTPALSESGSLPSPVTFKDNGNGTATISGTPATGTAGTYPITITANNGVGTAATQSFTLTVTSGGGGGIKLVQHTSVDAGINSTASLAFPVNNTLGNWIGVCIRAGQPNETFTVKDFKGNTYRQATQINQTTDGDTLAIFYAENIAAGPNTVTVSDSAADTLRFAILEFSGVASSGSIDMATANQGSNASPNSGSVTTTANGDLLLGAVMTADSETFTAGSGFQIVENVPAAPNAKLIVEDQIQVLSGSTSSNATLGSTNPWAAAIAAFKAGGGGTSAPTITSANNATFTVGSAGSFTVTTTGKPTPALSESGSLPSPVTFKDNGNGTATISGTPATGTAGTYSITITANNGVGTAATQSFTLTVTSGGGGGIKLVQHTSVDAGINSTASLAFPVNNTLGNWIGVCIRAGQPNETFTVKDFKGNTYRQATQINQTADGDTLAIFYAENIAAGPNTITVSDSAADTLRFAILEFSGVATSSSIDEATANQGSNASPNSGSVTTTTSGDVLLGVVMTADAETFTAGSGFQIVESVPVAPNAKLIVEYQIQATSGSSSAAGTLGSADPWAAVIAAFKP